MAYYCVGGLVELRDLRDGKQRTNRSQANFIEKKFLKKSKAPKITFLEVKLNEKGKRLVWVIPNWHMFKEACEWLGYPFVVAQKLCFIFADSFEPTGRTHLDIGDLKDYYSRGLGPEY